MNYFFKINQTFFDLIYKNFFNTNAQFGTEDKKKPKRSRNNDILANNRMTPNDFFDNDKIKVKLNFLK